MITPIIKDGIMPAERVSIYDVSNKTMDRISKQHEGIQTSTSIPDAISDADLIVMAVKPQNCPTVYDEIRRARQLTKDTASDVHLKEDATLLSVIAGKPISSYINGTALKKIARSMPNTPAQIGRGMTVWSCTGAVDADEKNKIKQVLGSFGKEIFVEDESFIVSSKCIRMFFLPWCALSLTWFFICISNLYHNSQRICRRPSQALDRHISFSLWKR